MARIYRIPFSGTLTNAGGDSDLFEILPGDDKPVKIVGLKLGQSTEVGDAAEEGLRISIIHMNATVTSGSGGSSVTPVKNAPAIDPAAAFTAEINNTTIATTSGTSTTMEELSWNIRQSPSETWWLDEDLQMAAVQTEALLVRCQTTPVDDISITGTLYVKELP